jgi:hypothetical protein
VRFEALSVVTMTIIVFADLTPYSLVIFYRSFWGTFYLRLMTTLKKEAAHSSCTSVNIYQNTRRHDPEDCNLGLDSRPVSSGIWRCIARCKCTDVSEGRTPSIFRVGEWARKATGKKQTTVVTHIFLNSNICLYDTSKQRNIPSERTPKKIPPRNGPQRKYHPIVVVTNKQIVTKKQT